MNTYDNKHFNCSAFFAEQSAKELAFLLFSTQQEDESFVEKTVQHNIHPNEFANAHLKKYRKLVRNLCTNELIRNLEEVFKQTGNAMIFRFLEEDRNQQLFRTSRHLRALYGFIHVLFENRAMDADTHIADYALSRDSEWFDNEQSYWKNTVLFPTKHHTNLLGLAMFIGRSRRAIADDTVKEDEKKAHYARLFILSQLIFSEQTCIDKLVIQSLQTENDKLTKQNDRQVYQLEKKKDQLMHAIAQQKALSHTVKQLKKEAKESYKKPTDDARYLNLVTELQKKDDVIDSYRKQLEESQKSSQSTVQTITHQKNEQMAVLQADIKALTSKVKNLTETVRSYEQETVPSFFERAFKQQEMDDMTVSFLTNLLAQHTQKKEPKIPSLVVSSAKPRQENNRIGYAMLENGVLYACFSDLTKREILNIPSTIYIGQYQFVLVSEDGTFKWLFNSVYQQEQTYVTQTFVSINRKGSLEPFFLDANGRKVNVKKLPPSYHLKENRILSINNQGEYQQFYPPSHMNADSHLGSIKAKGQETYYILNHHANGYHVRHIESGEESVLSLQADTDIFPRQIVCVEGHIVRHSFQNAHFYTLSSYYTNSEYGTAMRENGEWKVKKLSGDIVPLAGTSFHHGLQDGDAISIDEHHQLLRIIQTDYTTQETVEYKKRCASPTKNVREKKVIGLPVHKRVLIVGKITYEDSYRSAFHKKGYYTEIVDGYSPWSRVKAKTKNQDKIVVVTNFVSHENMWKIKEEVVDIPIIYSEADGANQIAERLNA